MKKFNNTSLLSDILKWNDNIIWTVDPEMLIIINLEGDGIELGKQYLSSLILKFVFDHRKNLKLAELLPFLQECLNDDINKRHRKTALYQEGIYNLKQINGVILQSDNSLRFSITQLESNLYKINDTSMDIWTKFDFDCKHLLEPWQFPKKFWYHPLLRKYFFYTTNKSFPTTIMVQRY